jgi:hypothetical protein
MTRILNDIDDLDRMIDTDAAKDAVRSQVRLIAREVAALEADHARLAEEYAKLQASQTPLSHTSEALQYQRGLYYSAGDPVPFCPHCWETNQVRIHLSGPIPMFDPKVERWECHTCDNDYAATEEQNFLVRRARRR